MIDLKNSILLTISTPSVIELATEAIDKRKALLKNKAGDFVELKPHQLKKDLVSFLEKSDITMEYTGVTKRRGKVIIAGVKVKVSPLNHNNYDSGALIKVPEEDDISTKNTVKLLKYLSKQGINLDKYCSATSKGTSCMLKLKEAI
jgi:hypothetical protein